MKFIRLVVSGIFLMAFGLFAAPDSLSCRMIDWLDVPGVSMQYGPFGGGDYYYSGTCLWDMAMGDSFLVWLPGTDIYYFVNPFSQTEVETLFGRDYGSMNAKGVALSDSFIYMGGGGQINCKKYAGDSLAFLDMIYVPFASFHYAVIRDTFLYTASTGSYGLHCINIANPESIFVVCTAPYFFGGCGMEVIDSFVFIASSQIREIDPPSPWAVRPKWRLSVVKLFGDSVAVGESLIYVSNRYFGDIATDGENLFYVNNYLSDWIELEIDEFILGPAMLGVWGTSYSYFWSEPDTEIAFGVEVLNENILVVGFEHGFSLINYQQLDGMREVGYYRDPDSIFCFNHFALKENRMFAMAHPRTGICRMYMFELDERIISAIGETAPVKPSAIEISAYPNPFNSAVTIAIDGVGDGSPVPFDVEIYDVNGRKIDVIARRAEPNEAISPNNRSSVPLVTRRDAVSINNCEFVWQPDPSLGSGVYLVRARVDGRGDLAPTEKTATKRIVYLK